MRRPDTIRVEPEVVADIYGIDRRRNAPTRELQGIEGMNVGFWFVGYDNEQPWEFFCDEESLTEAEWRRRAPADKVAELDDVRRTSTSGLFPQNIAAS